MFQNVSLIQCDIFDRESWGISFDNIGPHFGGNYRDGQIFFESGATYFHWNAAVPAYEG